MVRPLGFILIFVSLALPLYPFFMLMGTNQTSAMIAQYIGAASLISMAFTQFIATRMRVVEWVFGPMDQSYRLHKWLGVTAVITMLLHDVIGADQRGIRNDTALSELGENLGEIGMNGILVLVAITFALFIPYHLWRWSHKLMGAFFALCALHFILIKKPFALSDPLGLYITGFCVVGVICYAITLLPLKWRGGYDYVVSAVSHTGGATLIDLAPTGAAMRHRAGQFAFFRVVKNRLGEPHPFTISNAPDEAGNLSLTAKALGDYTRVLARHISKGDKVRVQGPFGRFGSVRGNAPQVWIAAGIGVTPFVALMEGWTPDLPEVEMFYIYRGPDAAPHLEDLTNAASSMGNLRLHLIDTTRDAVSGHVLADKIGAPMKASRYFYCGPAGLRKALLKDLHDIGVSRRKFHYEEFEIRSDIWLTRLLRDVIRKLAIRSRDALGWGA